MPSRFELADLNGKILRIMPVSPRATQVQVNTAVLNRGIYKLIWSDGINFSYQTILVLK